MRGDADTSVPPSASSRSGPFELRTAPAATAPDAPWLPRERLARRDDGGAVPGERRKWTAGSGPGRDRAMGVTGTPAEGVSSDGTRTYRMPAARAALAPGVGHGTLPPGIREPRTVCRRRSARSRGARGRWACATRLSPPGRPTTTEVVTSGEPTRQGTPRAHDPGYDRLHEGAAGIERLSNADVTVSPPRHEPRGAFVRVASMSAPLHRPAWIGWTVRPGQRAPAEPEHNSGHHSFVCIEGRTPLTVRRENLS